jgi:hypothetical protein
MEIEAMRPARPQRPTATVLFLVFTLAGLLCLAWTTQCQGMDTRAGADSLSFVGKSNGHPPDYNRALAVVASVLKKEFELPVSQTKFLLYPNREVFEANLIHVVRFDPVYAREVAGWAVAVGAPEMVLANEEALSRIPWSERIRVLAHELVHTVQYGLAGGRRGTSDQWLREGFADWIAYRVLESLDMGNSQDRRTLLLARIKGTARRSSCAPLSEMVTLEDFLKSRTKFGSTMAYGQSLLAAEFLVQKHGVQPVLLYFSSFRESDDRLKNFRTAFGEALPAFEKEFVAYLQQ